MKRFAALYAELDDTRATSRKLAAMRRYFGAAPAEDAAWGLYFLLGRRLKRVIAPMHLRAWMAQASGLPTAVIEDSYAHVGDLAETIALLFDRGPAEANFDEPLHRVVHVLRGLAGANEATQRQVVLGYWRRLPTLPCLLFNKLLTGALRVGVSAGLAARALAEHARLDPAVVQARLMGDWTPAADTLAALCSREDERQDAARPYPFCLAAPLEAQASSLGETSDWLAEWKWDGIRGQLIRRRGQCHLWSRGEELLDGRFPEIEDAAAALPDGTVLDGEILAWNDHGVMPFAALQQRIGRKQPPRRFLQQTPVRFMAYDLIERDGEDWRAQPLSARRAALEILLSGTGMDVSARLEAADWNMISQLREDARRRGAEGLMLKRLESPYVAGRKRGHWWKWKLDPLSVDTVLVYAQAGHGRRSNLHTDYTLAVRDGDTLVPVAKAYSGLTDAELLQMDRWIRAHTREKFGPVRSVEPLQVFEIAFEGIQASPRHKSGVALRFPRIARWRRDKSTADIDTLDGLKRLLVP